MRTETDNFRRRARRLSVASWAMPLAGGSVVAVAVLSGTKDCTPDWLIVSALLGCAVVPFGLGISIAVLTLVSRSADSWSRRRALAGLIVSAVLFVVLAFLLFARESVEPVIWAI